MDWMQFIVIGWSLTFIVPFMIWNFLLIYCVEDESPGYALVMTIAFIILIQFCSDFSFPTWINLNTGFLIKWGLAYIAIGVGYSVLKYIMYLTDRKRDFDREFGKFLHNKKLDAKTSIDTLPEEYKYECYRWMESNLGYSKLPSLAQSTKNIVFWMGYWPWSAFWTLLNNPLKWIFQWFKDMLMGLFRRLHQRLIGTRIDKMSEWKKSDKDGNKSNNNPGWKLK